MNEPSGPRKRGRPSQPLSPDLLYAAAHAYYEEDATQAQVAARLGVSRPTVSRLLADAKRQGVVEIRVHRPAGHLDEALSHRLAGALGLERVYLVTSVPPGGVGPRLAPALARALAAADLGRGDVLLVSSGKTLYQCAQEPLTSAPGVLVAPCVGGQEEPEPWYQTNVIAQAFAERLHGQPHYLYAPALPSVALGRSLRDDPSFKRISDLWHRASAILLGVGASPRTPRHVPSFIHPDEPGLRRSVGDICSRFYDENGRPVAYAGSRRLVAIDVETLRAIPTRIAVAIGEEKVQAIAVGARQGYFSHLVTDVPTAARLLDLGR